MRFERMSGLDEEQLSELEYRVSELLEEPWDKEEGRPRELTLREALVVTCGYMRAMPWALGRTARVVVRVRSHGG